MTYNHLDALLRQPIRYSHLEALLGSSSTEKPEPVVITTPTELAPPLPASVDPSINFYRYVSADPVPPAQFVAPGIKKIPYSIPFSTDGWIKLDPSKMELLRKYLHDYHTSFNPHSIDLTHPVHHVLSSLCINTLNSCKRELTYKFSECERIVQEVMYQSMDAASKSSPSLIYATAMHPKFELLEIAVRNHLCQELLKQHKNEIDGFLKLCKKFPKDLGEREFELNKLITKGSYYTSPINDLPSKLTDQLSLKLHIQAISSDIDFSSLTFDESIDACEKLVKAKLIGLQLEIPSQISTIFKINLRESLALKLISKQAQIFKAQFKESGTISLEEVKTLSNRISHFMNADGILTSGWTPTIPLLAETFGLQLSIDTSFEKVRASIKLEEDEQKNQLKLKNTGLNKVLGFFSRASVVTVEMIEALAKKKMETIDLVEKEWNAIHSSEPTTPPPSYHPSRIVAGPPSYLELRTISIIPPSVGSETDGPPIPMTGAPPAPSYFSELRPIPATTPPFPSTDSEEIFSDEDFISDDSSIAISTLPEIKPAHETGSIEIKDKLSAKPLFLTISYSGSEPLYIRGNKPGMDWTKGIELKAIDGKLAFEIDNDTDDFEFKILINDERWSLGENYKFEKGKALEIEPKF